MNKLGLFEDMLVWAKRKDSYSLKDYAKLRHMPYDDLLSISKENENLEYLFDMSKCHLASNTFHAWNSYHISDRDGLRYSFENDSELTENLIEEGDPVPQSEVDFEEWFERRWKQEKDRYGFEE